MSSQLPTDCTSPEWTESQAREAARRMLAQVALDPPDLKLLRLGNNGVFQVGEHAVIRVARPTTPAETTRAEVESATALAAADAPIVHLAELPITQPLATDGCLGTVWDYVPGEPPTFFDFGKLVREFHEHTNGLSIPLPEWKPLATARQRLDLLAGDYPGDDIVLLNDWYERISGELGTLEPVLPRGVIHGQAGLSNALMRGDIPVFLDFERVCIGPREWDLIDTAVTVLRFDQPYANYQRFTDAYGFDVTRWDGFATLRRVWELRATTWLMQTKNHSRAHATEVALRIDTWRDDEPMKVWRGF